jgi:hypothetical protein
MLDLTHLKSQRADIRRQVINARENRLNGARIEDKKIVLTEIAKNVLASMNYLVSALIEKYQMETNPSANDKICSFVKKQTNYAKQLETYKKTAYICTALFTVASLGFAPFFIAASTFGLAAYIITAADAERKKTYSSKLAEVLKEKEQSLITETNLNTLQQYEEVLNSKYAVTDLVNEMAANTALKNEREFTDYYVSEMGKVIFQSLK